MEPLVPAPTLSPILTPLDVPQAPPAADITPTLSVCKHFVPPPANAVSVILPVTLRADNVPTDVKEDVTTVEFRVVPVRVPAAAVTVMSALPLKETPLINLGVVK